MARILITGGAGFIGSHTCTRLIEAGHDVIVFDSFINSSSIALQRVKQLAGINSLEDNHRLTILKGDIRDKKSLEEAFKRAKKYARTYDHLLTLLPFEPKYFVVEGLKSTLEDAELVLHSQDNREHDILDSDDYYQYHGGLFSAVKSLSKSLPKIYFADNEDVVDAFESIRLSNHYRQETSGIEPDPRVEEMLHV